MSESTRYDRNPRISDIAESERPRERLLRFGAEHLSNIELFALIISSGTKSESAIDLASRVISAESGDLRSLSLYQPEEFMKIKGIGPATACKLAAAMELSKRVGNSSAEKKRLDAPELVAKMCEDLRHFPKEVFRILMLNAKCELMYAENVSVGGLTSSSAAPREVFSNAIRKSAYAVILVHNHPSGDPAPSDADIAATKQLIDAGRLLGVKVLDHIIIGDGKYISFKEKNILF